MLTRLALSLREFYVDSLAVIRVVIHYDKVGILGFTPGKYCTAIHYI
jgi:hypothetical protein